MEIIDFLIEDAHIIVPVLLILGKIIKETPGVKDWLIPYILLVLGVFFAIGLLGISFSSIIQGVLLSGAAVFTHQLITQPLHKNDNKK